MTRDPCVRVDVHRGLCPSLQFRHTLRFFVDASATGLVLLKGSDFEFFFDVNDCDLLDLLSGGLLIPAVHSDHQIVWKNGLLVLEPKHLKYPRPDILVGAYAPVLLFPL